MTWLWILIGWIALALLVWPLIAVTIHVPPEISGDDEWP